MSEKPQDSHGRSAKSPWQMPPSAWKEVVIRVWNQSWLDNIGLVAAGVAFYGFLALVPLLGILVLSYGLFAQPATVVDHVMAMLKILPPDVVELVGQLLINAVAASNQMSGLGILAALAVALYAGGNGAGAVMTALNIAYEEKESRSLVRFYAIAFAITLIAVLIALVALGAMTAVGELERILPKATAATLVLGKFGLYAAMALLAAGVAATLYRFGPSREDARWQWLTPGSTFTALVWLLLAIGFSFYVTRLTDYNATYGSVAAIVMLLTWMYLSAYIFLFGAELNAELEHQTARDSTTGQPEPIGRRGAWVADHVAGVKDIGLDEKGPSLAEAGPPAPDDEAAVSGRGK
ncbi:MAG TPA: YihY/virulence factor BrkB family protein [Sphingomicrobium sp.]|nr:YihY/virulence factor BrkB family protein [Sphingomicrobium sp.]